MADPPEIKILLLGDPDCGKSTFLSRIALGPASLTTTDISLPILRDSDQPFVYDIKLSGRGYRFEFYDTSCPTTWSLVRPDIIILCYDISQRLSLINVKRHWAKQPATHFSHSTTPSLTTNLDEIPILLLGLKRDLRSLTDPNGIIYPQEGHALAQELRADAYMECSARTGELVALCWEDICRRGVRCVQGRSGSGLSSMGGRRSGGAAGGGLSEGGCSIM